MTELGATTAAARGLKCSSGSSGSRPTRSLVEKCRVITIDLWGGLVKPRTS